MVLLAINMVGAFLATRLLRGPLRHHDPNDRTRILVITGFFGGLTSYSGLFVDLSAIWRVCVGGCLAVALGAVLGGLAAGWLGLVRFSPMTLLLISLFGALGCVVRYLLEYSVRRHHPTLRPWATVGANALGCGIAGYVAYRLVGHADIHPHEIVLTGFCGGLTTFSSAFAIPAILQREHHRGHSLARATTIPLACTGPYVVGMALAR